LIFDCDGTLADTMPLHIRAWSEAFADAGEVPPRDFLEPLKGKPERDIVEIYNSRFKSRLDSSRLLADKHRRFQAVIGEIRPIEPVVDVARFWLGRLPMAVVSGGTRENVRQTLEVIGILSWFPVVLTADDGLTPKPAPDMFLEAARRLDVSPSACRVFEDGDLGLEAARAAGMTAVDVRPWLGAG
jgi:beta-phosphoglucomutase-like phosphatase (HAD superfamily)